MDEVVSLIPEEQPRNTGEKDKKGEAQPIEVDNFRAEVEAIQHSPWFVNSCGDILTDVFNGMSNL